jgi:CBS domain-containing protein
MSAFTAIPGVNGRPGPRVADVMHRGLVSCARDASLQSVADLMAEGRVHCVVVTDDAAAATALWGVVSDLDLVAAATVRALDEQTAGVTATTPAITVAPHDPLQRAAFLMIRHDVSHLVVVEPATQHPVGVISTLDLATVLASRLSA